MSANRASPISEITADLSERERDVLWSVDRDEAHEIVAEQDEAVQARLLAMCELGERADDVLQAGLVATGKRRTPAEMCAFRCALHEIFTGEGPMTVRGAFYRMVARGLPKTEAQYNRVQDEAVKMRRAERLPVLPYECVIDGTRWMRKPTTYHSLRSTLEASVKAYRRAVWDAQDVYVEVWCEKDALSGVLYPVTAEWDVPLMVSRGYASITFLHEAAETIRAQDRPAHIYMFTDRDRSGGEIAASIERDLHEFAPGAEVHCHRAAVTEQQVKELNLPTRPAKRKGDPPAVELDAIPPTELRRIVRNCIEGHVDHDALRRTRDTENVERETLRNLIGGMAA